MMSTNTEDATRRTNSRKRSRRTDDDEPDAAHGSLASSSYAVNRPPSSSIVQGTRLEPIMDILESQPTELKGTTISLLNEMLDLRATIKQRVSTHARYDKPTTNAATGAELMDVEGAPKPFIPTNLRRKCPIEASKQKKNEARMLVVLEEAETEWNEYITKAAAKAEAVSKLEIDLRQEDARSLFYDLVVKVALSNTIIKKLTDGGFTNGMMLSQDELATKAAYEFIREISNNDAALLWMENGINLAVEFAERKSYNDNSAEEKLHETDSEFLKPITAKLAVLIPKITADIWRNEEAKELQREINAALTEALRPKKMVQANDDVERAMDNVDANNPPDPVIERIQKETKKAVGKEVQHIKRQLRKKYSADDKTKSSQATENGRRSNKRSSASQKSSNKKSGDAGGQSQPKSVLKKGKQVKFKKGTPKKRKSDSDRPPTPGKKRRGGRGADSSDDRQRSAGRR